MKTGFKDPIAIKQKEQKIKDPWDFRCPQYDQRSSCFIQAGTDYGVGHRTPVGTSQITKSIDSVIPKGRVNTLEDDHVSSGRKGTVVTDVE